MIIATVYYYHELNGVLKPYGIDYKLFNENEETKAEDWGYEHAEIIINPAGDEVNKHDTPYRALADIDWLEEGETVDSYMNLLRKRYNRNFWVWEIKD